MKKSGEIRRPKLKTLKYGRLHPSAPNMQHNELNFRENSKMCENSPPFERRVSTQFLVFQIPLVLIQSIRKKSFILFYNVALFTSADNELYQHGS